MILGPAQPRPLTHASPQPTGRASLGDVRPSDVRLDQYYTRPDVAEHLYAIFQRYFDPRAFRMVEPSAGTGSFYRLLPRGSLAYDVDPSTQGSSPPTS